MKYAVALLLVTISMVSASHLGGFAALVAPSSVGATIKGPSAAATVVGPDGSSIAAAAEGGAVVAPGVAGGVVNAAVAHGAVVAAVPHVVPHAPVVGGVGTVVAGPSGVIATNGNPWGWGGVVAPHAAVVAPGLGWGHNGIWW